jgi:uncharacterized membrane protein
MNDKKIVSYKRHVMKTITWRLIGTTDTILISWIISGDPLIGIKIGSVEVISKMVLYFIHERLWYKLDFGVIKKDKT